MYVKLLDVEETKVYNWSWTVKDYQLYYPKNSSVKASKCL